MLAFAVLIGFFAYLNVNYVEVNPETNCPIDDSVRYDATVILIDATDPLTPTQKKYVQNFAEELAEGFTLHEKVSIYRLDEQSNMSPKLLFSACNPGHPEEANIWYENPELIRQNFETNFFFPFKNTIIGTTNDRISETSPIIETLQTIMNNHALNKRVKRTRLIVISDMLQNVMAYSHYRNGFKFSAFLQNEAYASRALSNFVNIDVSILYLVRGALSNQDMREHINFWEQYISMSGGRLSEVQKVR